MVVQQLDSGYQIARITVNGKTGTRHVRLNNSYPRLKDWLSYGHPYPGNPNSPLFCGTGRKNTGKKLARNSMFAVYGNYKKVHFPKLLQDPMLPEEDKRKIVDLLKKPWNPYIRRHTAATEISKALKDSVLIDQYMGWSHAGNTRQKYQHYYNDDSFDAMLVEMDGLKPKRTAPGRGLLKPRLCPNCSETNKPESRFCSKCRFVLSFDAFNEKVNEAEQTKQELKAMKDKFDSIEQRFGKMMDMWETMGRRAEEREKEIIEKKKLSSSQSAKPSFAEFSDNVELLAGHAIQSDAKRVRELRKELHD